MSQLSLKYFFDYKFLHASENFITIPDGSKVRVKHIGTVRLNDNILLHNVLMILPRFSLLISSTFCFTSWKCVLITSQLEGVLEISNDVATACHIIMYLVMSLLQLLTNLCIKAYLLPSLVINHFDQCKTFLSLSLKLNVRLEKFTNTPQVPWGIFISFQ